MPEACHSSYNLLFKLKIVAEAEAMRTTPRLPENRGSVSPWFVAGEKIK